jgi:hypothetical protein
MSKKIRRRARRYLGRARRRAAKMTIPIAPLAGFLATPAVNGAIQNIAVGHWQAVPDNLSHLIGIDPNTHGFNMQLAITNWSPMVIGLLVHKIVGGKLGVNATLAKARIPFLRL